MTLHIRCFLSFALVCVLVLATACGQQPPQVSDPSLPAESDVSDQPGSSTDTTTATATTARAQVKGRALTPESLLLGLVDLDTRFPVTASTSPSVKWTEG